MRTQRDLQHQPPRSAIGARLVLSTSKAASARELETAALFPARFTRFNLLLQGMVLRHFESSASPALPQLRRALDKFNELRNLKLPDISFSRKLCFVVVAAATARFKRAVYEEALKSHGGATPL